MNRVIVIVVSALAATRLMRAWFKEDIGEPFREPLEDWLDEPVPMVEGTDQLDLSFMDTPSFRAKDWAYELVTCPYCLGFWTSFALVVLWPVKPVRRLAEALAASMLLAWIVDHDPAFQPDEPHLALVPEA